MLACNEKRERRLPLNSTMSPNSVRSDPYWHRLRGAMGMPPLLPSAGEVRAEREREREREREVGTLVSVGMQDPQ